MKKEKIRSMCFVSLGAVLITLCAWVTVPSVIPFTAQTFGVSAVLFLLGGKKGLLTVFLYLSMGALGLPVFSGFLGGAGILFGKTGGYLMGFLVWCVVFWAVTCRKNTVFYALAGCVLGLVSMYVFGTLWYTLFFTQGLSSAGVVAVLSECVFPFIVPDAAKLVFAFFVSKRMKKSIRF